MKQDHLWFCSGLIIEGGVDTPTPEILIKEVTEGGAAEKDGFLQV